MTSRKKICVVGLSGGVDSAVAALLLKQQGYAVHGIFMKNWEADDDDPFCGATQDLYDAKNICLQLDIPFEVVNFSRQYWDNVFQYFLDEYAAGRTPNPDILCNKEIKFKALLNYALEIGADYLATGHYARCQFNNGQYQLLKGIDQNKDQSYFLYTLGQEQLKYCLFPVGELEKPKVRTIAKEAGFINHAKKDSTGICFIGERKFKEFLKEYLLAQPGNIETDEGQVIGRHEGLMYYTLGQRKGIGIGGQKNSQEQPWYVIDKDIKRKVLIVGQGQDHPVLLGKKLICTQLHWNDKHPSDNFTCKAKIRYRQMDQICHISKLSNGQYQVEFDQPQRAITPGQSVVFYQQDKCLGGGIIN